MKRLAYYPAVETPEQLIDIVSRAAWFLTFSPIERISIPVSDPELARLGWQLAPGMDPEIATRFDALWPLVEFVPVRRSRELKRVLAGADAILRWRAGDGGLGLRSSRKPVFEVDPRATRTEGGNYINVSYRLGPNTLDLRAEHEARFGAIAGELGEFDRAFVLATGPSVGAYGSFDYGDSLGIVCNTVVLDEELMSTVRPRFVVFCDPIFHFGPSQYAAEFRAKVREAAQRYDFTICLPAKYFWVWAAAAPELAARTVAIPFEMERPFNFDLISDFEVATTSNVLTFVMLPLATTFAKQISVLGCDGRPLSDDGYFWQHNPATQLTEQMANVRAVHPGFFDLDYNDYYLEHCNMLERQLQAGEAAGYQFESLVESHIPALKRRTNGARSGTEGAESVSAHAGEIPGERPPRLLVIDATRVSGRTATGQLKRNFLDGWRDSYFRQLWLFGGAEFRVARALDDPSGDLTLSSAEVLEEISAFEPEVIYYRPTIDKHPQLHELALQVLERHPVPLVTQIMDDWPQRLAETDPDRAVAVDRSLRELLAHSDKLLSISEKMSGVFRERYGMEFEPIANGVDRATYVEASRAAKPDKAKRDGIVVRYCGALAEDMTFDTMVDVARAVDALQGEVAIRFEVYTMPTWRPPFEQAIAGFRGTKVGNGVFGAGFPTLLAGADVLVFGYNFDSRTIGYIGLSVPNKLPEYLASGAAVLAVGPMEVNGIEAVVSRELACSVTERSDEQLVAALRRLATDRAYREQLAEKAQAWVFEHLDLRRISGRFQAIVREAAESRPSGPLLGPFTRAHGAKVDEGDVIAHLIDPAGRRGTLLDVGAHRGTSSATYAEAGWRVVACEPDDANRTVLTRRFRRKKNVTIDPRAVSDSAAKAIPFYSSKESTGISSLHAFHTTHEASQSVEVTTVAELADAHGFTEVDLLKIDVEGFDLNVLKGVPWDRFQPQVIECEFEDRKTESLGYLYTDMADFLVAKGYTVYVSEWHPIVRYGIPHQWRQLSRYPATVGSEDAWGNFLAFRDDPGLAAVREAFEAHVEVTEEAPAAAETAPEAPSPDETQVAAVPQSASTPESPADPPAARAAAQPRRGLKERAWAARMGSSAHPIRVMGRLLTWCARLVRKHPVLVAASVLMLGLLTAAGFVPELDPWGKLGWAAAGLLLLVGILVAAAGFANFLVGELRSQTRLYQRDLRRRFERDEEQLRSGHGARMRLERRVEALGGVERRVETLDGLATKIETLDGLAAKVETLDGLAAKVETLDGLSARVDALARLEGRVGGLEARLARVAATERRPASSEASTERLTEQRLSRLEEAQHAGREQAGADLDTLDAEHRAATAGLNVRIGSLESKVNELAGDQARIAESAARGPDESRVDALESRLTGIEAAQADTAAGFERRLDENEAAQARALRRRLAELEAAQAEALSALDQRLRKTASGGPSAAVRRHVSLQIARSSPSADFDGVVLVLAPQRSGSTWLLDLLRCHPNALMTPTAEIYRRLDVSGRRYPPDLSDGSDAGLSIEVEPGVGSEIPVFEAGAIGSERRPRLAVERIHPSAISFDSAAFLAHVAELERSLGGEVRICYLTRDPGELVRSYRSYRAREPRWGAEVESSAPEVYRRSFETLNEIASSRPGPLIRYEELVTDPVTVVAGQFRWLWPAIGWEESVTIAARAVDLTRIDRRQTSQSGPFLGPTLIFNGGPEADEADGLDDPAIPECRRLSRRLEGMPPE